jgi:ATPase subunit of ABC transporter with duplicated ATPase domains
MDHLCGSLSGGQQKIIALGSVLATNPDVLLLDEPENHIDIVSRVVLIKMLQEYKGSIIFISHDRLIIDALATKVAEMAQGRLHISEGGYDEYIEKKMERIGGMQRAYDAESKRIKQLESSISILAQKAFRGKEISLYKRKKAELEKLKDDHSENSRPEDKKTKIKIHMSSEGLHQGKLLCRMSKGFFRYEGKKGDMFRDVSLEMRSGKHIVLLGRNGSGKSTFLKCLMGEYNLNEGTMHWGTDITRAYFDQHVEFAPNALPVDIVMEKLNCVDVEARAALGSMRFDQDMMETPIKSLSGGERMRLRFAIVFGQKPDLIVLDEPTNHLDEVTWEILLDACKKSKSTILLVSHDYEFIEEFKPHVFWMCHGQSVVERYKDLPTLLGEMGA